MAIHMSIRLAWHSDGWNGHICKRPCENSYCIGQHSYPGDLIASTRDLEFEAAHAGESCSALPCKAACGLSVNAFGKDTITVRVDPPSFWKKNDADAINITLPPSTVCTWCYEAMYNDEVEARGATAQKYDYAKRKEGAENYFAQFEPGKSLIFYYAGYSNPFSENEEDNYVIVGVSRVSKIGDTFYYDNTSDEVKRKYAGGFVWQKPVTSTYPDEGFCIPYWKYMDDEEILNRIVIKPQNRGPFKYGSREVYNDDAIEVVNQLIAVVDTLIEIGDDTEDWNKRKAWLNSVLNELWTARGPYPGFPSILESLGLHTFVSSYIGLTFDDEMKEYRIAVREFLEGNRDDVQGMTLSKSDMKKIRREYQLLDDDTADFMFEILSRFDLRADQVCSIVSEDRENVSITASIAEMKENPYIIFEQYIGYDSDDVIPFYRIDNGVIPSPEYGIDEILDCGSTERLRAFCVDELNRIAAHSFGKAKSILKTINARVERLPEWKRYVYRMKNFDIDQEIWEGALVQKKDDQGILYLYLKENYEDERTIEDALRNLADRPDITLKMAITPEKFKRGLRVEGSPLEKKTAAEYDLILEHQAEICMQIFVKPLCVLSGAAGTGKTTVIRTILDNIERVHGAGTSFLLMAPTGKAAERIKTQTGKPSSTIHSYLAKNGWINENFTLKRIGGRDSQDINTIIIDECSMIDLNLMATLFRAINWNSIQRLILIGDPNQLSPIGRGRVFADTIEWLNAEYPQNVGTLTDNIRQLVNRVEGNGNGILNLAEIFIQEHQQLNDGNESARLKAEKESLFEQILESGNGDVDKDLGVYFWNEQEELESVLTNVMVRDMQQHTGMDVTATGMTYESIYRCKRLQHSSSYQVYSAIFTFEYVSYLSRAIAKNNPGELFKIGVIAPYRAQADMIDKLLASEKLPKEVDVQVGTIHGFQGDECDIIFAVFNTPPTISASKDMFLNKRNIINVSISRARDYLFVVMPDDDTDNISNLRLVKRVESLIQSTDAWNEFLTPDLEELMFGDAKYLENNAFSTSHQSVNVYGLPEKIYEVRTEDTAVDVQIHRSTSKKEEVDPTLASGTVVVDEPQYMDSYDLDESLIPEELRDTAIDLPVRGAINGWCYLVPYEGKLKSHTVKKVIGMFIPQNRNGQEKMVSVSVVKEDRIIYISKDMFKIYEQSLSEPDGIQLKRTFF